MDTLNRMVIEFDPGKNAANFCKHGIALADCVHLEWDDAVVWQDLRHHYGEARMCAIAYIGLRLYVVV